MSQPFSIRECLHGYTNEALGVMCARWQAMGSTKSARLRAVERVLLDPQRVSGALQSLEPYVLRLLHVVAAHQPTGIADVLSVPGLYYAPQPTRALQVLAEYGFVLVYPQDRAGAFSFDHLARERHAGEHGPLLTVPDLVGEGLPPSPPLGIPVPVAETPEEPRQADPDRGTMLFLDTLRIVEQIAPRVTSQDDLHKADEARALDLVREAAIPADSFSLALMAARYLGCVEVRNGRLCATARTERWVSQPCADRVRDLFRAYLHSEGLADVRLFFPELYPALEERLPAGSLRRRYHKSLLAAILREQKPGAWHRVSDVVEVVRQVDPNVLFLEEQWRAIQSQAREVTSVWLDRTWHSHEARLLSWIVSRQLVDLAVVETSEDGGLFRVTPFGRYALDAGPAPTEGEPEYGPSLVVQPDFEVLAYLDRCAPGVRRKLDVSCERVRGGTVATYRLTKEALYRSLRNGMQPGRFMELLTRNAMRPIPDNIREQIASWERRLDAITLRTRCELLEYLDAEAAREFAEANPGSRQIGDRFVLLASPPKEGPITHIDYRQPLRRFLQQEKGLQFRVPWQRSSLFVRRMLGGIADLERARTGDLMVTLNRRRFNGSDDWSLVAAELEALSEGPLAPRYRLALRAWAGEVNPVMSGSATLLRFDDPEVCEAVMEQPSVTPLIEGRLGLYTLVVRPGSLTTLKRLMKEQGITVTPGDSLVDPGPPEAWLEDYTRRRQAPDPEDPPEDVSKRQEATASDEGEMLPSYSPRIVREILEDAIQRRHPVLIAYQSAWNPRPTTRKVNPVSLDVTSRTPALSGYCHLHGGARSFKLAQIAGIRVLEDDTF